MINAWLTIYVQFKAKFGNFGSKLWPKILILTWMRNFTKNALPKNFSLSGKNKKKEGSVPKMYLNLIIVKIKEVIIVFWFKQGRPLPRKKVDYLLHPLTCFFCGRFSRAILPTLPSHVKYHLIKFFQPPPPHSFGSKL